MKEKETEPSQAKLQPRDRNEITEAIANIKALGKRTGKVTREELLSARHEGHKY